MSNYITGAYMVPHPPLIIPEVGRGEEKQIHDTVVSYQQAADEIAAIRPDTIVLISSHVEMYRDYLHIAGGRSADGDFGEFRAPQVKIHADYDTELTNLVCAEAEKRGIPAGTEGERLPKLDHASMIPLYFLNQKYTDYKVLRVGISSLSYQVHRDLGKCIADACEKLQRRTVVIASGDLSHKLLESGPYGYAEEGPIYDQKIMEIMGSGDFDRLDELDEDFCSRAAECGHRTFLILAGILSGYQVEARKLSYEGPFGVGYGVCAYRTVERDPYVRLARASLETYVRNHEMLKIPKDTDDDLLHTSAGAFVSLHENGDLRGCIGTMRPVRENVAQEIIENAVSAGTQDMRFYPVDESELPAVFYSVDVLGPLEKIKGPEELDVKKYGVLVSDGYNRGVLLPDLEGVDTVEQQIEIARRKAGIRSGTPVTLYRFEVVRHV